MRTTVELPPDLLRKAKARAAQRGETLRTLLTRAVVAELGQPHDRAPARARVQLPLVGDPAGPTIRLRAADLERALAQEDARRAVATGRRRRR